ncbi:MAG: MFS transporter, partial [Candidatus Faecousia sp.]|nr:MFS transporter [Candidatus Faecousia sp.]
VVENMYFNVFVYRMFHASAGAISLMVGASAAAATVTTLLIGALSDRIGKRKLFICGGYILWGVTIWSFSLIRTDVIGKLFPAAVSAASVGVSLVIIMDCVMTFFGSSANDACFNAWLTDMTADGGRGAAEGVNSMMPLLAVLVVFGGFMGFDLNKSESWNSIFTIIGVVVTLIGIAGLFLLEEPDLGQREQRNYFANILYGFRPKAVRENPVLYRTLLAVAAFNISIQVFMPYLILYYTVSLQMDNYVLIMAPAIVLAAVFTAFYGRVYDRVGFRRAVIAPMALLMAGYLVLYFCRGTLLVFIGSLLMMCSNLGGGAMLGAMVRDRTPQDRAGMFQGLRICAQVLIPGIIGPAIGAWVLRNAATILNDDGTSSFIPNANIFLAAFGAAIFLWLALIPLLRRKE